jgi:hypothetical protein
MRSRLAAALLALLLFAAFQELALRWVFPLPPVLGFDRGLYSPQAAEGLPARLGGASFTWTSRPDGYRFVHRLNLLGFRDGEWRLRPDGLPRVAFVGDSFVEGFGAGAQDTLPAVFRRAAAEHGVRLETLDLGVGGADLARYAQLIRDAVPLFRPGDVVLVLYANDLVAVPWDPAWLEGGPAIERPQRLEPRLLHVLRRLARGEPVPRRWPAPPFSYLPAVPDPRNPWSHEREAARLARSVSPEIARAMREGEFNPALADWFAWARRALARPVDWTPHLAALDAYVERAGARLWLVYLPTKSQVTDRYLAFQAAYSPGGTSLTGEEFQIHARWLARSCAALGIPFLDLTPLLRELEAAGPELYWRYDDHLRPRGYRAVGERLFAWWSKEAGESRPTRRSPQASEAPEPEREP